MPAPPPEEYTAPMLIRIAIRDHADGTIHTMDHLLALARHQRAVRG
jgi:hypothetical protein